MFKSILFLDIDGVLNSHEYAQNRHKRGMLGIDKLATVHLQRIVDETGCVIVLSSTWRLMYSLPEMASKLHEHGMKPRVPLIGATPSFDDIRGVEVKWWMDHLNHDVPYAILDDDSDFLPGQPLVQTTFRLGLTPTEANRCISILNHRPASRARA